MLHVPVITDRPQTTNKICWFAEYVNQFLMWYTAKGLIIKKPLKILLPLIAKHRQALKSERRHTHFLLLNWNIKALCTTKANKLQSWTQKNLDVKLKIGICWRCNNNAVFGPSTVSSGTKIGKLLKKYVHISLPSIISVYSLHLFGWHIRGAKVTFREHETTYYPHICNCWWLRSSGIWCRIYG